MQFRKQIPKYRSTRNNTFIRITWLAEAPISDIDCVRLSGEESFVGDATIEEGGLNDVSSTFNELGDV